MKYITDLDGTTMPVNDVDGCIRQVAVILENDITLTESEKKYWLSIEQQLLEIANN